MVGGEVVADSRDEADGAVERRRGGEVGTRPARHRLGAACRGNDGVDADGAGDDEVVVTGRRGFGLGHRGKE
jgi:hypothetical protein